MSIDDSMRRQEEEEMLFSSDRIRTAITADMTPDQRIMFEVSHVLFCPNSRGLGRTTAMLAAQLMLAVENPGREIEIIDHTYGHMDTPASMRHAASVIEQLLAKLPEGEAENFRLTGHRLGLTDRMTIRYAPHRSIRYYKEM